jgi:hypothetical protein
MKARSLIAAAAALLLGPLAAWAAPSVVFTPSSSTVNTGGSLTVTVSVTGLASGGLPLSDYDLAVSFDPTLVALTVSPYSLDPQAIAALGGVGGIANVFGIQLTGANYFEDQTTSFLTDIADLIAAQSSGGLQIDSFNLFNLTFTALGTAGVGAAANFSLGTISGPPILDVQDSNYSIFTFNPSAVLCVNVNDPAACTGGNPAPEPASYALVLLGLAAAGAARKSVRPIGNVAAA